MKKSPPIILLYERGWPWIPPEWGCPTYCQLTLDRSLLEEADAVVFHIPTTGIPTISKRPGQVWVAWTQESEVYFPLLGDPHAMRCFDLTMTYRRDADIWIPYFNPWLFDELMTPPRPKTGDALAVCFITALGNQSGRQEYVRELMEYVPVASYGRFMKNRSLPHDPGPHQADSYWIKRNTIANYKFTLAFENSIAPDYVTEKLYDPLVVGSVPVYLGAPNVADYAPADHCYIDVADFSGPRELAAYLQGLAADDALYKEYLAWKEKGLSRRFIELAESVRLDGFCRLCSMLRYMDTSRMCGVGPRRGVEVGWTPHRNPAGWTPVSMPPGDRSP